VLPIGTTLADRPMRWREFDEPTRRLLVDGDTDGTYANHSGGVAEGPLRAGSALPQPRQKRG
jgi:hypothetical protein